MHDTLSSLVERALTGKPRPLEFYLRDNSRLPGPRANLELAADVGHLLAAALPRFPDRVRALLNYFANGDRKMVTSNTPSEFIMLCGIIGFGICAAARADWRPDTLKLLDHYATSSHFRVLEGVATAFQHLLSADAPSTIAHLRVLAIDGNCWQQRAVIASIAEPALLCTSLLLNAALELQRTVLERFRAIPTTERKREEVRQLRRTLGYTLSVVTAALPEQGFALMRECATWQDTDIAWILRENLKKKRLAKYVEDTASITAMLS